MLNVRRQRDLLDSMLVDYGLSPDCLEIVPDIQAWCREHQIDEENPWRVAKCFYSIDSCHIVMREEITDSMICSAKTAMELKGFESEVPTLDTDRKFLVHLMLHEIGCFTLQTSEQEPRDKWASHEMHKYAA